MPASLSGVPGLERAPGDARDRRQRLAPESEGREPVEVGRLGDLARRVPLEGEKRVVPAHAAAVVLDSDQGPAAVAELDLDPAGAGVQGVFDKLLDHRGRPLDDLAGGDLVRHPVGQDADSGHSPGLGPQDRLPAPELATDLGPARHAGPPPPVSARSRSKTRAQSGPKPGWIFWTSGVGRAGSGSDFFSASATTRPTAWCAFRNGTPRGNEIVGQVRRQERRIGRGRRAPGRVHPEPGDDPGQDLGADADLVELSKIAGLSSWRSRLYVSGRPFASDRRVCRLPWSRAAFPRRSSPASGFRFWGMSEEPV